MCQINLIFLIALFVNFLSLPNASSISYEIKLEEQNLTQSYLNRLPTENSQNFEKGKNNSTKNISSKIKDNVDLAETLPEFDQSQNLVTTGNGNVDLADDDDPCFTMETFVTIVITLAVVICNCLMLIVAAWTEAFSNYNKTFIYSLVVSDLCIGLFIMPYSTFHSVYRKWVFSSDAFCSLEAYLFATFMVAKIYSLTWLSVDHYVAVRKPERYNSMMSPTRSLCWIVFSWIAALSFSSPPMFSFESAIFNNEVFMCLVETTQQIAYVVTSFALVSMPAIIAIFITNAYLFTKSFKKRIQFYEKVFVELSTRPWNYHVTFVMNTAFVCLWIPFTLLYMIVYSLDLTVHHRAMFYLFWMGQCGGFTHFVILMILSTEFRVSVREMCRIRRPCYACVLCSDVESDVDSFDVNVIHMTRKR